MLLGRWTRIVERHGGGCSCCPGLGDVAIDEVERRVTAWVAQRHPLDGPFSAALRASISERRSLPAELYADLDEALSELERTHILQVLRSVGGNKALTSRRLGLDRKTLYRKLKVYGIAEEWRAAPRAGSAG